MKSSHSKYPAAWCLCCHSIEKIHAHVNLHQFSTGWWLNQPIGKICLSNRIISLLRGENTNKSPPNLNVGWSLKSHNHGKSWPKPYQPWVLQESMNYLQATHTLPLGSIGGVYLPTFTLGLFCSFSIHITN